MSGWTGPSPLSKEMRLDTYHNRIQIVSVLFSVCIGCFLRDKISRGQESSTKRKLTSASESPIVAASGVAPNLPVVSRFVRTLTILRLVISMSFEWVSDKTKWSKFVRVVSGAKKGPGNLKNFPDGEVRETPVAELEMLLTML